MSDPEPPILAALKERALLMLLGGAGRPVASGKRVPPAKPTKGLVVNAHKVLRELFKDRRTQIVSACTSGVDQEEMVGFLVADASGWPLLPDSDARAVGKKATVMVKKIKAEEADARRSVRRRAGKATAPTPPEAVDAAVGAAAAAVLAEPVELPLPTLKRCLAVASSVPAKRAKVKPVQQVAAAVQKVAAAATAARIAAEGQVEKWRGRRAKLKKQMPRQLEDVGRKGHQEVCVEGEYWLEETDEKLLGASHKELMDSFAKYQAWRCCDRALCDGLWSAEDTLEAALEAEEAAVEAVEAAREEESQLEVVRLSSEARAQEESHALRRRWMETRMAWVEAGVEEPRLMAKLTQLDRDSLDAAGPPTSKDTGYGWEVGMGGDDPGEVRLDEFAAETQKVHAALEKMHELWVIWQVLDKDVESCEL